VLERQSAQLARDKVWQDVTAQELARAQRRLAEAVDEAIHSIQ